MIRTTTLYNGIDMHPTWPAKIRAAQRHTRVMHQGTAYPRVPYGQERAWEEEGCPVPTTACRDCSVLPGQLHVPQCCVEACPLCLGGQAITCELEGCRPPSAT